MQDFRGLAVDTKGRHLLLELWECEGSTNDAAVVQTAIEKAVTAINATIVHLHVHPFQPQGITGFALLAESHLSIHTWPEGQYVAADIFTCGTTANPENAIAVLQGAFGAGRVQYQWIERGTLSADSAFCTLQHSTFPGT